MALVSDVMFSALILAAGVFGASTLGFAVAWLRARERAIRAEERAALAPRGDARFDRLEQAVEAVAVEVERMSEGQRFVSKLLAERVERGERVGQEQNAVARPPRVVTPH